MQKRAALLLLGGVLALTACAPTQAAEPSPNSSSSSAPPSSTAGSAPSSPAASTTTPTTDTKAVQNPAPKPPAPNQPAPSGTPGWQLDASNTGLAPHGLNCDALPVYTGGGTPPAGTVITGKRIEVGLSLFAGGITIERSCIRPTKLGTTAPLVTSNGPCGKECPVAPSPSTIRDSEFDGSALSESTISGSCAFLGVATLQRNYMHGMGSGICFFNTGRSLNALAEGNYVTKLRSAGESHNDGATVRDFPTKENPNRSLVFRNNRIDCSTGRDTGALFIQTWGGDIDNVTVEGNLLEGGGYNLGLEAGFDHVYGRNMRAVNNRFRSTEWGPSYVTDRGLGYAWAEWRDNFADEPAAADHKGKPLPK